MPIQLAIKKRTRIGSRESRRLRREGFVPGVVYGKGDSHEPIKVEISEFMSRIGFAKSLGIINLDLEGETLKGIIKEVQWDCLSDKPVHLDFQQVSDDQMVTVPIPLHLEGIPLGVSIDGGILDHSIHEIEVTVRAADIVPEIICNVGELRMNERLHLSGISLPEGMTVDLTSDPVVASVLPPKTLKLPAEEESAEEEEESAEPVAEEK
jgi:large subunit ribosomal protein L25